MSGIIIKTDNEDMEEVDELLKQELDENDPVFQAKSFLENIEDELSEDIKTQVKTGLQDFTSLLSDLELDPRLASLWKLIYSNAMTDRKNAFALWLDLYVKVFNQDEKHFQHGQTLHKYMEAMSKANQQLLKLAELVDKARDQKESFDREATIGTFFRNDKAGDRKKK